MLCLHCEFIGLSCGFEVCTVCERIDAGLQEAVEILPETQFCHFYVALSVSIAAFLLNRIYNSPERSELVKT